jgi:hypothetical protein
VFGKAAMAKNSGFGKGAAGNDKKNDSQSKGNSKGKKSKLPKEMLVKKLGVSYSPPVIVV